MGSPRRVMGNAMSSTASNVGSPTNNTRRISLAVYGSVGSDYPQALPPSPRHVGIQCELGQAEVEEVGRISSGERGTALSPRSIRSIGARTPSAPAMPCADSDVSSDGRSIPSIASPAADMETDELGSTGHNVLPREGAGDVCGDVDNVPVAGSLDEDGGSCDPLDPAVSITGREARKMRLFHSQFVEGIDFTKVHSDARILLKPPLPGGAAATTSGSRTEKPMSLTQLRAFIAEVYKLKKVDDLKRDKVHQPRRALHVVLQELVRRQHGVKKVLHQKSWQLVEAISQHADADPLVDTFSDFVDGSRDIDELSFYLYCTSVLVNTVCEESSALPPSRLPSGLVTRSRARRVVELLFGDLPKALDVMTVELDRCTAVPVDACNDFNLMESGACAVVCVDDVYRVLLEGWRMSALLLDKSVSSFSWRLCTLAFVQSDLSHRGWLDEHEVRESEAHRLRLPSGAADAARLPTLERTSLGSFVLRAVRRCGTVSTINDTSLSVMPLRKNDSEKQRLEVSKVAFVSLEKTLEVYLSWLMHSEALRDLSAYHTLKAHIYGFHQASGSSKAGCSIHHFRCLLLLLLAHQFDVQLQQAEPEASHLDWEFRCILRVLRESWKRGSADRCDGPDFGPELESIGE